MLEVEVLSEKDGTPKKDMVRIDGVIWSFD